MEGGFEFEVLGTDLRHQEGGMNRQNDIYIEFYPCVLKDISPLEPLPNKVVGVGIRVKFWKLKFIA